MTTPIHTDLLEPSAAQPESILQTRSSTVSAALTELCFGLGIRHAFGITGGGNGLFVDALGKSKIEVVHCRHETGAAFAATEASLATDAPALVFATTGPGILNALNGVAAARWEGGKVLLITGVTGPLQRGRWSAQETSAHTMPVAGLFSAGTLFHYAETLYHPDQLQAVATKLALGYQRPQGFVAHLSLPMSVQALPASGLNFQAESRLSLNCQPQIGSHLWRLIGGGSLVIWVGFGARHAAREVLELAERSGARVIGTPRGKGTFPENHPQYLGVTGMGGHDHVEEQLRQDRPDWVLVLGTRLGEGSSFWSRDLVPKCGFIHVDLDPDVPGAAYPDVPVHGVIAQVGDVVRQLLDHLPQRTLPPRSAPVAPSLQNRPRPVPSGNGHSMSDGVRMRTLMPVIQRVIVDRSDAVVMADAGNAFAWAAQELRFCEPKRFRISTGYGSMAHFATGVIGAALARRGKAVAIVGDGSLLMNNEISTAAAHGIPAVWVVLNDACYSMVDQGMRIHGQTPVDARFPRVDFVSVAKAMGADGIRVDAEHQLDDALEQAMSAPGPFLVDVHLIANAEPSPVLRRVRSLMRQTA